MSTLYEADPVVDGPEAKDVAREAQQAALDEAIGPTAVSGVYTLTRRAAVAEPSAAIEIVEGADEANGDGRLAFADDASEFAVAPTAAGIRLIREQLNLDVDGGYPQRVVSGTIKSLLNRRLHWIARLRPTGANRWAGPIFYKNGTGSLLTQTSVKVAVLGVTPATRVAKVTFSGPGGAVTRTYKYSRAWFRAVEFEYDCQQGQVATTTIQTHAHPNRPPGLPSESLSLETVYRRAGFKVTKSGGDTIVPTSGAGGDARWSDQEMHDAMQLHWSQFQNAAQWSLWVFWARQHVIGFDLGGIMFDDIGPNHRQGTAIFNESFITDVPPGDPNPAAWVRRMKFWTAAHEMGHAFNLAHSWQKSLGTPWIPLADEPEARSFMNYPFLVSGGQSAFFSNFAYRFSNSELFFMRHAPERFVQMGNADWFDHHGFEQAETTPEPDFELTVRMNRDKAQLAFMEPAVVELKLKNVSGRPQVLESGRMRSMDSVTVIVKRKDRPAKQWRPFAHYCVEPGLGTLEPGASQYESLFIGAGTSGWLIDEPGTYLVQVALHLNDRDVVSNALHFRVAPPRSYDEEAVAEDMFSDSVARIVNFGGSLALGDGNDALREVAERLDDKHPAAIHARYALGSPLAIATKQVVVSDGAEGNGHGGRLAIKSTRPQKQGRELVESALREDMQAAADTFGHIGFRRRVEAYADALARQNQEAEAKAIRQDMVATLRERGVPEQYLQGTEAPSPAS
jgi:hypothetical protein